MYRRLLKTPFKHIGQRSGKIKPRKLGPPPPENQLTTSASSPPSLATTASLFLLPLKHNVTNSNCQPWDSRSVPSEPTCPPMTSGMRLHSAKIESRVSSNDLRFYKFGHSKRLMLGELAWLCLYIYTQNNAQRTTGSYFYSIVITYVPWFSKMIRWLAKVAPR